MTELEKAIAELRADAEFASTEGLTFGGHQPEALLMVCAAASSWAALVWREGAERPEREDCYLVRCVAGFRVWEFFEGRWSDDGIGINAGVNNFVWLDGSLPPVPEATDEG